MEAQNEYQPGVCNIGEAEIQRRLRFGWIGLALFFIFLVVLLAIEAPPLTRFILFLPAFGAAMGFVQAKMHFCAYFGLVGIFNMQTTARTPEEIWEENLRKADRRKAWHIIMISLVIAACMSFAAYLIPFIW
jgi:hypothetical protein